MFLVLRKLNSIYFFKTDLYGWILWLELWILTINLIVN